MYSNLAIAGLALSRRGDDFASGNNRVAGKEGSSDRAIMPPW
jgi:hypothetical protein